MNISDILKAIFYGILEGVTEWLPVSSTGHLILFETFWPLNVSESFLGMFRVVIQLGAILAVAVRFFRTLNPWDPGKDAEKRRETWQLWAKILIGVLPAGAAGLLLNSWADEHLMIWPVVAAALIFYGAAFLLAEKYNAARAPAIESIGQMTYGTAFRIGLFQALSIIPGTSRSGASILGAMLLGVSRPASAQFSFLMAIPIMLGYSLLKCVKFLAEGTALTGTEILTLILGMLTAFAVSLLVLDWLLKYVQKHDFRAFGVYRIALGLIVAAYFLLR